MAIKVKSKIQGKAEFEKSLKANQLADGDYKVTVLSSRFMPEGAYEDAYFIDLRIDAAPKGGEEFVGKRTSFAKFMGPYKNKTTKTGGTFTVKQQREKDEEAIQVACAACLGYEAADAGNVTQEQFDAAFEEGQGSESPLVGRSAIFRVKSYTRDGDVKRFGDLLPIKADGAAAVKTAAKAPPPPSKPAKPPFEDAAKDAGFAHRDDAPGWYWNESTEEQLDKEDLAKRLGFDLLPF